MQQGADASIRTGLSRATVLIGRLLRERVRLGRKDMFAIATEKAFPEGIEASQSEKSRVERLLKARMSVWVLMVGLTVL